MRPRALLGIGLLTLQAGAIARARVSPARYFCWAPHDSQSEYRIGVTLAGQRLDEAAIERRYRLPAAGVEARSIQIVLDVVRQYEETYGAGDGAEAVVRYRVNGGEEEAFRWPAR